MKIAKLFLYSMTGGSSLYVGHKIYSDGRLDPNNFGIVRFGRAALAVGLIGVDYKRSIFSNSILNFFSARVFSPCRESSCKV